MALNYRITVVIYNSYFSHFSHFKIFPKAIVENCNIIICTWIFT